MFCIIYRFLNLSFSISAYTLSATMSGAAQAGDPVSGTPAAQDTQPTEPASGVSPGNAQAVGEGVTAEVHPRDEQEAGEPDVFYVPAEIRQPTEPASGVPPGNAQTARDIGEAVVIDISPGDEQTAGPAPGIPSIDTGEAVVINIPPEDEQATEEDVAQQGNTTICDIIFKIIAAGIKVIDISFEALGNSAAAAYDLANILSPSASKLLLGAAIFRDIKRNAGEIRNIVGGCLQCEVRCFTEDIFLEVLRDHETGMIKKHLEEEYLKAGYEMTGLEVKIQNREEVKRTKTAIEKRYVGIY